MNNNKETPIRQLLDRVEDLKGAQFASITYRAKKDKSLARYNLILGFSYGNLLEKSKTELEILMNELDGAQLLAAKEVMESILKSITAHKKGEQSEDYTKKDQYIPVANGVNINKNDGTVQLFGLVQSKVELEPGEERKPVKSSPATIMKNKIRSQLSISKFREFAIDMGQVQMGKINGQTLEIPGE